MELETEGRALPGREAGAALMVLRAWPARPSRSPSSQTLALVAPPTLAGPQGPPQAAGPPPAPALKGQRQLLPPAGG